MSNDDSFFEFDKDEMMEIAESEVFQNYLLAKYDIKEIVFNANRYYEKVFSPTLGDSICYIPQSIGDKYIETKNKLIKQFPHYNDYGSNIKYEIHSMAVSLSSMVRNHLGEECKYFIRTRSGNNPENNVAGMVAYGDSEVLKAVRQGMYAVQVYDDFMDAFFAAREWGRNQEVYGYDANGRFHILAGKEIGGFVYDDCSALEQLDLTDRNNMTISYDEQGNWSTSTYSGAISQKMNRDRIVMHYHYHPDLDPEFSNYDKNAMKSFAQKYINCHCEIIITDKDFIWMNY